VSCLFFLLTKSLVLAAVTFLFIACCTVNVSFLFCVLQLKAPDAKLMPIREDVEELFEIEESPVNIHILNLSYNFYCVFSLSHPALKSSLYMS